MPMGQEASATGSQSAQKREKPALNVKGLGAEVNREERLKLDYISKVHSSIVSASKGATSVLFALFLFSLFFAYLASRIADPGEVVEIPFVKLPLESVDLLVIAPVIICALLLFAAVLERYETMVLTEIRTIYRQLGLKEDFLTETRIRMLAFPTFIEVVFYATTHYGLVRIVFGITKRLATVLVLFLPLGSQTYVSYRVLLVLHWPLVLTSVYSFAFVLSIGALVLSIAGEKDKAGIDSPLMPWEKPLPWNKDKPPQKRTGGQRGDRA
jgi:hypothetical protein